MTMYSSSPPLYQNMLRLILGAAWGFVALGGLAGLIVTPRTIETELGSALIWIAGSVVVTSALPAVIGVALRRFRYEWVASWFTSAGLILYAGTLWWLVFSGASTRLMQASFITALLAHTLGRVVICSAHAARLRAIANGETGPVDLIG